MQVPEETFMGIRIKYHEYLSPFHYRTHIQRFPAINGSRLILGSSMLGAIVFIKKNLIYIYIYIYIHTHTHTDTYIHTYSGDFLSCLQCSQFLICSVANIKPLMAGEGESIFKFLLNNLPLLPPTVRCCTNLACHKIWKP